jgi:hypothetical protein
MWKFLAVALVVLVSALPLEGATVAPDPMVLVGTWKGEVEPWGPWPASAPRGKIVYIDSIKQEGGKWATETRYETVGEGTARVDAKVEVGDKISVKFDTPSRTSISLDLSPTPPWELSGTYSRTGGGPVHRLKLRKVE